MIRKWLVHEWCATNRRTAAPILQSEADAPLHPGLHAFGIEVQRQKRDAVSYQIDGAVLVQRSGIPPILVLPLESRLRELQVNDRVTYDVYIPD